MWQAEIPMPLIYGKVQWPEGTGLEVNNDTIYISVKNVGIVEFPGSQTKGNDYFRDPNNNYRNSSSFVSISQKESILTFARPSNEYLSKRQSRSFKKPKVYTQENGLPSILITSIARDGDKLWIAYGAKNNESGLGLYYPKIGKWESIFCSTFNEEEPFNAGCPYKIGDMKFNKQDQLYFTLYGWTSEKSKISDWIGLWKINTNNYKSEPVITGNALKKAKTFFLKEFQGKWWVWDRFHLPIIEFDPVTEKFHDTGWDPYENSSTVPYNQLYSAAIQNDIFWGPWSRNQIIKIQVGKKIEEAEIIDNNILDGKPAYEFISTPYGLIAIGDGTVGLIETDNLGK